MRNFTIYLAVFLCLIFSKLAAQATFESRARAIGDKIEQITKEEKDALKTEVEAVNNQLENGTISNEEADEQKLKLAEIRAKNIETRTAGAQDQLRALVQEKVDGQITDGDPGHRYVLSFPGFKVSNQKAADTIKGEKRTTTQSIVAFGLNNLETNKSVAHSDYKIWGSYFYEWGFTYNTRILKDNNLLHAKYGLSLMYNNLRATDNRLLVENGKQTNLEISPVHLKDSRFKNVNLVLPVHLEFDFSGNKTDAQPYFKTHQGFRFGIGGYVGANVKSKQILKYERNGNDVKDRERGDFNVNEFIYGISSYIGYKETSLYVKYDLNPVFADNTIEQRNISLGLRFDLN